MDLGLLVLIDLPEGFLSSCLRSDLVSVADFSPKACKMGRSCSEKMGLVTAVEKIEKSCDLQEAVNLSEMFSKLTNDVVCRVTFGKKYSEGENERKFNKMLKEYFHVLSELNFEDMIPWLWWVDRLRGTAARVEKVAKDVDEFLDGLVEIDPALKRWVW